MLSSIALTILISTLALVQANAPVISNEPAGAAYQAILQSSKSVQGQFEGLSSKSGTGVQFSINLYAFPTNEAPFGKLT